MFHSLRIFPQLYKMLANVELGVPLFSYHLPVGLAQFNAGLIGHK
jgi:hypothetical protein